MPRIEITAKLWPQVIDGDRYDRVCGDVVEASDSDAARLIKAGAAKTTKRKVSVADQKGDAEPVEPKTEEAVREKEVEEAAPAEAETYQDTYELLPPDQVEMEMPANAAKAELWQDYAIAAGMPEDVARGMKRDEIRKLF